MFKKAIFVLFAMIGATLSMAQSPMDSVQQIGESLFKGLFYDSSHNQMEELSDSLLSDPYVLVDLKVTKAQLSHIPARQTQQGMILMFLLFSQDLKTADPSKTIALLDGLSDEIKSESMGLRTKDLDATQTAKLEKIIFQRYAVDALQTKETAFLLKLTEDQRLNLATVRKSYEDKCDKLGETVVSKKEIGQMMEAWSKKMTSDASSEANDTSLSDKITAFLTIFKDLENLAATRRGKIEQDLEKAYADANEKALGVLTPDQRKIYDQRAAQN